MYNSLAYVRFFNGYGSHLVFTIQKLDRVFPAKLDHFIKKINVFVTLFTTKMSQANGPYKNGTMCPVLGCPVSVEIDHSNQTSLAFGWSMYYFKKKHFSFMKSRAFAEI
jgi:hypothetical protein